MFIFLLENSILNTRPLLQSQKFEKKPKYILWCLVQTLKSHFIFCLRKLFKNVWRPLHCSVLFPVIVFPRPNVLHLRVPIIFTHLVDFTPVSFPVTISVCSSTSRVQALFCYSSWFLIPVLSFDSAFYLDLRFRESVLFLSFLIVPSFLDHLSYHSSCLTMYQDHFCTERLNIIVLEWVQKKI